MLKIGKRRLPKASNSESGDNGESRTGDFSPLLDRLGEDGTDPVDPGWRRMAATLDTVCSPSGCRNGEFISTGLVLPLLLPEDDGGETEDSSPKTNTSPCKLGVFGVGIFTNGEFRPSKLGVGDGGADPLLETESDRDSGIGFPNSSALWTK